MFRIHDHLFFVCASLVHIGVNFRSSDGPRKTVSENSLAETRAKNTEANVDPVKGFAVLIWLVVY